jgi:hypothetical protein
MKVDLRLPGKENRQTTGANSLHHRDDLVDRPLAEGISSGFGPVGCQ